MESLFLAAKRTEYADAIKERDKALRRHERHRASVLQRRIDRLALEILEAEMAEAA